MKILNSIFKEASPVTTQNNNLKAEKAIVEPLIQDKMSNEAAVNLEYTSEEDMIKAVFEAENKEMSKEDLKTVKTFIKEAPGTLTEKLEALKMVLKKNIPLTTKHLRQVNLALNSSWPDEIKNHMVLDEPKNQKVDDKVDVYEKKSFKQGEKLLFDQPKKTEVVTSFLKPKENKESFVIKPSKDSHKDLQMKKTTDPKIEELPVKEEAFELKPLDDSFVEPLEEMVQVLSELMAEPSVEVLKFVQVKVTKEMAEAKETFDVLQKNIHNKLQEITPKSLVVDGKDVLVAVIDKLDHILMKSNITLYTDMTTERELLSSSSALDKARVLIKDQPQKAFEIIQSVKEQIDKIVFRPSREKMFGVIQKQFENDVPLNNHKNYTLDIKTDLGLSPRNILETLRAMGLNHEVEVSEILNKNDKSAFKSVENMKSILMKLESAGEDKVVKSLDLITGLQLVNKLEVKSQKQHLMFHMPVVTPTDIKDMKIHVNGQKNNQKMDWQNSRLYFVVHLDQIGDTGILVEVQGGKLSMTIKNDFEGLEEHMSKIVTEGTERLKTAGFETNKIKFDRLTKKAEDKIEIAEKKEGFDVII